MTQIGTIVIPAYKASPWIERALDSVARAIDMHRTIQQARQGDFRIVVVDDASPDDVGEKAMLWAKRQTDIHFVMIRNTRNCGAAISRNLGAKIATGELLWFLDADDEFLPPHLAAGVIAMDKVQYIGAMNTRIRTSIDIHSEWLPKMEFSSVFNLCVRRECHEFIGGFPETDIFRSSMEDLAYKIILSAMINIANSDIETVIHYHRTGNNFDKQLDKFRRPLSDSSRFENSTADPRYGAEIQRAIMRLRGLAEACNAGILGCMNNGEASPFVSFSGFAPLEAYVTVREGQ